MMPPPMPRHAVALISFIRRRFSHAAAATFTPMAPLYDADASP